MLQKKHSAGALLLSSALLSLMACKTLPPPAVMAGKDTKTAEIHAGPVEEMLPGTISKTETGIKVALTLNGTVGTEISSGTAKDCFELETLITQLTADSAAAFEALTAQLTTDSAAATGKTAERKPDELAAFAGSSQADYRSILEKTLGSLEGFKLNQIIFSDENRAKVFYAMEALYKKMGEATLNNMDRQIAKEELRSKEDSKSSDEILNEANCMLNTAEIMLALSDYKEKNGKCPENLNLLVPAQLKEIPAITLPGHSESRAVRIIDEDFKAEISSAVKDTGGWLYFSNPKSNHYCVITPDCSHKNSEGKAFYTVGIK
ncbi:MAG: hypothetical protein NTX59_03040 [Elusimicrobia bacterium]|nr:hypothetical protein [Elusimicrobiota bacterium]